MVRMLGKAYSLPIQRLDAIIANAFDFSPGRFFAATGMKLFLAQVLRHYDVEPLPARVPPIWWLNFLLPPMSKTIRVKRRSD